MSGGSDLARDTSARLQSHFGGFADTQLEPSSNAIFCLTLHWQTVPASPLQSDLDDAVAMHFVIAKNIKRGAIYPLSLCSRQRRTLYEIGRLLG